MSKRRARNKGERGRSYLKRFSQAALNTGHSVDGFRIKDSTTFHYTARARSMGLDEDTMIILERMFGFPVRTESPDISQQRKEVLDKIDELKFHLPGDRHVVIMRSKFVTVKLFFNDEHTLWFFREERRSPLCICQSITYGNRERALTMFAQGTIRWKQKYIPTIGGTHDDQGVQLRQEHSHSSSRDE